MNAITVESCPSLAPRVRLQLDKISGLPVLLYPEGLLELNETGHAIVQRCDGATPVRALVASLAAEFEAEAAELTADVIAYLADLQQRQLITVTP